MPRFCFIGDLHFEALDKYFKKETNPNEFIFQQLTKILNYCRKAEIKNVFQLGDVFDQPYPDQKSIREFLEFLHKHSDLNFHIIAGNHDYSNIKTTSLEVGTFLSETKLLSNVNIYTKAHHEVIEGVNVFFAPYPTYEKFDYLKEISCLCLGHFEVKGAKHDSGQIIKNGIAREELDAKDYWVLGHLHRHQNIDPKLYYTGTALQYNFGEPLPKGFVITNLDEQGGNLINVTHNYIELETPYILENVHIYKQEDFNKLHYNNPQYYYKIFLEASNLIIPQNLLNGTVTNVYKIIRSNGVSYQKESLQETDQLTDVSLSEAFTADYEKEQLFEPLGGLDSYLAKHNFTEAEIRETHALIEKLKVEFNPKRN